MSNIRRSVKGFAWHTGSQNHGGRITAVLHLNCTSCTAHISYNLTKPLNPHLAAQWFERKGWSLDPHNPKTVKCPACVKAARPTPAPPKLQIVKASFQPDDGTTPGIKVTDLTRDAIHGWRDHQKNKGNRSAPAPTHPAKPEQARDAHPVTTKPEGEPVNQMTSPAPPALTTDQKAQARDFLDRHFNPDIGQYAAGHSDEIIAKLIKPAVPYASIAAFRELAYGELKGDPELNAIREALAQQRKELDAVVERAGRLESSIATTEKKLAEVVARKFKP